MFSPLLLTIFAISSRLWAAPLAVDPAWGRVTARCAAPSAAHHAWIFKQWHADAGIDTHDRVKAKALPQAANQTALYRQLEAWILSGRLDTVVAEGCSGKLTPESKVKFNGWTVRELAAEAGKPGFDEIVASVPEKLEAGHSAHLNVLCGDDDELIRRHLLAFSDVRGAMGFLFRLLQYRNDPDRARGYLEGTIEAYKLPRSTSRDQAVARLQVELRAAMGRLKAAIEKRNEKAIGALLSSGASEAAIVYGGLHAPGLLRLLEAKGWGCTVVEPVGYRNDEGALLEELEGALRKLGA